MTYDFTSILDRQGRDALALERIPVPGAEVRPGFSKIPMWVADMNFAVVPTVTEAIIERAKHPAFGYFELADAYYDAVIRWQRRRNGAEELTRDCIGYENGVLGGVLSALDVFCSRGDKVLLHTPTYIGFSHVLKDNGYEAVYSPLRRDEAGIWRMDFADMEEKLRTERVHAAIFCSPHNPTGRVWEKWEIEQAMELFKKYGVGVVSDEIWSDILLNGHRHVPTQSVSEDARHRTVALYAPSKTFNLAGLVGSYHIVYDGWLRDRMEKQSSLSHYNSCNVLSMHALTGAYREEGERWVDELNEVLSGNVNYVCDYMKKHFPGVRFAKPEGTYMLFLDCGEWCRTRGRTMDELLKSGVEVGVIWQDGRPFLAPDSIRMNLALPFSLVREAMARLNEYVF